MASFRVHAVNVLEDNFAYVLVCEATKTAAWIDPAEADKVAARSRELGAHATMVLTTHHHEDHAGGNEAARKEEKGILEVVGGDERVQGLTRLVKQGEEIEVGRLKVRVLSTPCHTSGSVSYFVEAGNERAVFTGDTLFLGGCGRFFEGTAEQMQRSLNEVLAALPEDTAVYCGHEYTVANLKFARHIDPDNKEVAERLERATRTREEGKNTVPGTIGEEKRTNPFMRTATDALRKATGKESPVDVMMALREAKNNFKA